VGENGADGAAGADGVDGATWLYGTVAPIAGQGKIGDFYFNTATAEFYVKKADEDWFLIGSLDNRVNTIMTATTLTVPASDAKAWLDANVTAKSLSTTLTLNFTAALTESLVISISGVYAKPNATVPKLILNFGGYNSADYNVLVNAPNINVVINMTEGGALDQITINAAKYVVASIAGYLNELEFQQDIAGSVSGTGTVTTLDGRVGTVMYINGGLAIGTVACAALGASNYEISESFTGTIETVVGNITLRDNRPGHPLETFARNEDVIKMVDWQWGSGTQNVYLPATIDTPAKLQQWFDENFNDKIFNIVQTNAVITRFYLTNITADISEMTLYIRNVSAVGNDSPVIEFAGAGKAVKKFVVENVSGFLFRNAYSNINTDIIVIGSIFKWDLHSAFNSLIQNYRDALGGNMYMYSTYTGTRGSISLSANAYISNTTFTGVIPGNTDNVGVWIDTGYRLGLNDCTVVNKISTRGTLQLTTLKDTDYGSYNDIDVFGSGELILSGKATIEGTLTLKSGSTVTINENWTGTINAIVNEGGVIIDNRAGRPLDTYLAKEDVITEVIYSLYVSPNGDDNNDGKTPETPLKHLGFTLNKLIGKIVPTTTIFYIYLMPGTHVLSQNQEDVVGSWGNHSIYFVNSIYIQQYVTSGSAQTANRANCILEIGGQLEFTGEQHVIFIGFTIKSTAAATSNQTMMYLSGGEHYFDNMAFICENKPGTQSGKTHTAIYANAISLILNMNNEGVAFKDFNVAIRAVYSDIRQVTITEKTTGNDVGLLLTHASTYTGPAWTESHATTPYQRLNNSVIFFDGVLVQ
jgi:hypothetical protein